MKKTNKIQVQKKMNFSKNSSLKSAKKISKNSSVDRLKKPLKAKKEVKGKKEHNSGGGFNFETLSKTIEARISSKNHESYSYKLFMAEFAKIAQKIGEEGVEVALAAMLFERQENKKTRQDLIGELCDLFYHSLILMFKSKISLTEIYNQLEERNSK